MNDSASRLHMNHRFWSWIYTWTPSQVLHWSGIVSPEVLAAYRHLLEKFLVTRMTILKHQKPSWSSIESDWRRVLHISSCALSISLWLVDWGAVKELGVCKEVDWARDTKPQFLWVKPGLWVRYTSTVQLYWETEGKHWGPCQVQILGLGFKWPVPVNDQLEMFFDAIWLLLVKILLKYHFRLTVQVHITSFSVW